MLSLKFLAGVAVGAAAMRLLDPDRGRGRRARLVDQVKARARRRREEADRRARYEAGLEQGAVATERGAGTFTPADDVTLADHLRQILARMEVPTDLVNLEVVDRVVRLRGQVDTDDQVERIVRTVASAPGVSDVECYLHLPGRPAPNKEAALAASARVMR